MALSTPTRLQKFEEGSGVTPTKSLSKIQVRNLGDASSRFFKCMLYGKGGTGKTYSIISLIEDGQKVCVFSTDVGGDGLSSVEAEMRYRGKPELLKNVTFLTLPDYDSVNQFLKAPEKVWPGIYEWNPDFLFWDGFSNYQQVHLQEEVELDESVMKAADAGSPLKYWGAIKRETQREYNRFLMLHDRKTGKLWHKVVTCLEDEKFTEEQLKGVTSETEKMKMARQGKGPMVQGAAAKLMGPGCDLVIRTIRKTKKNSDTGKLETSYLYETVGTDKIEAKVRGLRLEPIIPADFGMIWELAKKYYGLVQGAVNTELVEAT